MYDGLADIERNYGCVAEYNRSRMEDEEYEYEMAEKARKYYAENSNKYHEAMENGTLQCFCYDCIGCEHYREIGPRNAEDDVEHGACLNPKMNECKCSEMQKRLKEHKENKEKLAILKKEGKRIIRIDWSKASTYLSCEGLNMIGSIDDTDISYGWCDNDQCKRCFEIQDTKPFK